MKVAEARPWYGRAWTWALLLFCAFAPSVAGGFVFDDQHLILNNAYSHELRFLGRAFRTHLWDVSTLEQLGSMLHYYRPLVASSYIVDWWLGGGKSWNFHVTNVLLHALNVWLVVRIGRRFSKSDRVALLAGLVFAFHPTRTENVSWISGRPDLLATTFSLLMLEAAHIAIRRGRAWAWPASGCLFVLALLSKETALAAPLLLGVEAYAGPAEQRRRWALLGSFLALLGGVYLALREQWLPVQAKTTELTPLRALVTIEHYVERILWPWPQTFFYKPLEFGSGQAVLSPLEIAAGALCVLAFIATVAFCIRRRPLSAWLLVAAAGMMGPLLNFSDTTTNFVSSDRFLYLPLWLLALGLLPLAQAALRRLRQRSTDVLAERGTTRAKEGSRQATVALGVVLVYVGVVLVRGLDYASPWTLWQAELSVNDHNPTALANRAALRAERQDLEGAISDLRLALSPEAQRYARLTSAEVNVGSLILMLSLQGQLTPDGSPEAIDALSLDMMRILAGEAEGPVRQVGLVETGFRLNQETSAWVLESGTARVAMSLVPLVSRLDRSASTTAILDLIGDLDLHRAPSPLAIPIAEAREERFGPAVRRLQALRARMAFLPGFITKGALDHVEAAIGRAELEFATADRQTGPERALARARGYFELDAYHRALREIRDLSLDTPDRLAFKLRLLVAARLDRDALELASQALGPATGPRVVDGLVQSLPPSLRALNPIEPHGPRRLVQ